MAKFFHYLLPILVLIELGHSNPHMGHEHEYEHHHSGHKNGIKWDQHVELKKMTGVDLKWNISDPDWIVMEMSAKTTGYVSVGFCSKWVGSMKGCDIVLGWVEETGKVTLTDYHADSNKIPIIDESQDYELLYGKQENHATTIGFRRKWNTEDEKDAVLGSNLVQIIYAWHPVDPTNSTTFLAHDKNTRSHTTKMVSMKTQQHGHTNDAAEPQKSESSISIFISVQSILFSLIFSYFMF